MLDKIKLSTVVGAAFFGYALFYFYISLGLQYWSGIFAPGPGFIPRWTSGFMVVLSAFAVINSFKEDGPLLSEALPKERTGKINLFVSWGVLFFILFFVEELGFLVTASIALTVMFSRGTSWPKAALFGVIFSLCCFVVFKVLLQMQIPVNQFGF